MKPSAPCSGEAVKDTPQSAQRLPSHDVCCASLLFVVTVVGGALLLLSLVAAAVWALLQLLNIAWPRPVFEQRYLDWSVWIAVVVLGLVGAAVYALVRPRIAPAATPDEEAAEVAHDGPAA